ncbi:unnamed protein product [Tilletia controversa]|uniref:Zn(2)-C6 fungal-type domain-containing protein n=3 Tax=Tilletia TaxID=13289 RepID=A0A8X7MR19_9BASI|nr:hypothetical protein CF336_g4838 [Tilletia laevis]KAE8195547.1 hypothetical protein CF328_g4404 [Tilletia controversa]KAE8259271.1 hypothetical protein A4X03_0g4137 [Tilletia caries]KAE8199771.1 hypothetical protein CF335_g4094 [Tilletia laevis]KAE8246100.1 hypothetical protein A4X06_0g5184 [Tilletia controversa]
MSSSAAASMDAARRERGASPVPGAAASPPSTAFAPGPPPLPKHSSFFTPNEPSSRASPYVAPTPPQTSSSFAQGGVPSFLERGNSDAFKYNVLPALGSSGPSTSRTGPNSPRLKRMSSSASSLMPDATGSFPGWSGAPSTASSGSSISGALHGPTGPRRGSSPSYGGGSSKPLGSLSHSASTGHLQIGASSASFNTPPMHGPGGGGGGPSSSPAFAHTYRNGASSVRQGHHDLSMYAPSRHPESHHDQQPSSSHLPRVASFSGKPDSGAQPSRRSRDGAPISSTPQTWHSKGSNNPDEPSLVNHSHENDSANHSQAPQEPDLPNEPSNGDDGNDASQHSVNSSDRKVSCLECRTSKVKCTGKTADNKACARCQRICRQCIFAEHRRGRRPDVQKFQKLEKSLESVTKAFDDFRKTQDPESKGEPDSKQGKAPEREEPAKKKQRKGNNAPPRETSPALAPHEITYVNPEMAVAGSSRRVSLQMPGAPVHPAASVLEHSNGFESDPRHGESVGQIPVGEPGSHREPVWYGGNGSVGHPMPPGPLLIRPPLAADSRSRAITIGCHVSLPDCDMGCDPIARNVITMREACELFETFMKLQNQYLSTLDFELHTFEFVRDRSPFLLTVICIGAARLTEVGNNAAPRLQHFLDTVLLPAIWQGGLRSVEIVQGLTMLSAFHDVPNTSANDLTWQYITLAYGQAIQLGLNLRPKLSQQAPVIEQRLARNGERAWLMLFLLESLSAQHLGRRSMFNVDRFIGSSDSWHHNVVALPADRNIVALVQLRRTQIRLHDLFESTIADPATGEPALTAYRFDIFIRTCMGELDTWKSLWYDSVTWAPHEQGLSREILFAYLAANLNQCVLALRACPGGDTAASILRQASRTAVDALNVLIVFEWPDLVFTVNQNVVIASYCAILALRMTTHEKRWMGAGAIDPLYIFDLVDKLVVSLSQAGTLLRRSGTALTYASYLGAILDHYESQHEAAQYEAGRSGGNGTATFVHKRRRAPEMNVHEFEASPVGVIMIPKHPHSGMPALVNPPRASLFSDMTFFDTFFEEL